MTPLHHIEGISERVRVVSDFIWNLSGKHTHNELDTILQKSHLTEYLTFIDGMIEEVGGYHRLAIIMDNYGNDAEKYASWCSGNNYVVDQILSSLKSYREIISKQMK